MQTDYLDLYFCHRADKNTPIEETVLAMNTLIQQGKILYWGTSEWSAVEIMEAHRVAEKYRLIGPTMEQPQYNLFERQKVELDFADIYSNVGLGTTIWSPLATGLLTGKYNDGVPKGARLGLQGFDWLADRWLEKEKIDKVKKLASVAKELNCTLAQMSIAWCAMNPNVSTVILGATKKEQLNDNLKSLDIVPKLTTNIIEKIEKIMKNKPKKASF
jgi:aryl-alcohol dehydrogenase-like predicted oxidoreductase